MRKFLLLGMADSSHLANWLENMGALDATVVLISSPPHRNVHPKILNLLQGSPEQRLRLYMPWWSRRFGLLLWALDRFLGERLRGKLVRRLIYSEKPDVIHAIEFQHSGYILLRAVKGLVPTQTFQMIVSNYGSDIYWFQRFPRHKERIRSLIALADVYTCECARDISLAENLGFQGHTVLIPNTGGVDYSEIATSTKERACSGRDIVMLKGYQGKFGRAITGVFCLWRERQALEGFKVVSFSTNLVTAFALHVLRSVSRIEVSVYLKGQLAHRDVLKLMAQARLYIGLSRSDGISTSLLEAMAMGAFPIQTGTSCANEWIVAGQTGAIVSLDDVASLRKWIRRSLKDNYLVDEAQHVNSTTIAKRYTKSLMAARVQSLYHAPLN
jgi:hypothetical protein